MFGPHLIIDGSRCDTRKLADRNLVEQVLNAYPDAIGMTKIGGPYMFEYQAPDPAYSGVSGLVVIAESHIALHTFPELDYFTMDIFSCKNFDHERAIEYIRDAFDVREMDRMLVQRGLSFKGPHHGKLGATDELIAAAQARLAAGIVSKEPALPDVAGAPAAARAPAGLSAGREAALARHAQPHPQSAAQPAPAGRMIWPQYGVTPDYGTYGDAAADASDAGREPRARDGAPTGADGRPLHASEPVQVNPTASVSGLLDKLAATGRQGRALGRALAEWERLVRDPDATVALALNAPVIADGLRETLVYAVERRYVDAIVLGADDLFADLYEALGHAHYDDGRSDRAMVMTEEGRARVLAFFGEFLDGLDTARVVAASDLWRLLGEALPARAPRKGLLQAAATAGVPLVAPDVATSTFGAALLAARGRGVAPALDAAEDLLALARALAGRPRLGVIRAGDGPADALLVRAREAAPALGLATQTLVSGVSLGGQPLGLGAGLGAAIGDHAVTVAADVGFALPLLLTGLAQRFPGARARTGPAAAASGADGRREAEAALA